MKCFSRISFNFANSYELIFSFSAIRFAAARAYLVIKLSQNFLSISKFLKENDFINSLAIPLKINFIYKLALSIAI